MIHALAGWMLVQPLGEPRGRVCVGRVHSIGELYDDALTARLRFGAGDRVCWPADVPVYALNDSLVLVPLQALLAYELASELADSNGEVDDG